MPIRTHHIIVEVILVRAFMLNDFLHKRPSIGVTSCVISCESPLGLSSPLTAQHAHLFGDKSDKGGSRSACTAKDAAYHSFQHVRR